MAVVSDLDMMVNGDLGALPGDVIVASGEKGTQCLALNLFEQRTPRDSESLHRPVVQSLQVFEDRQVGLVQRLEAPIAQRSQDPALDDLDADLDLGLVAGRAPGSKGPRCCSGRRTRRRWRWISARRDRAW